MVIGIGVWEGRGEVEERRGTQGEVGGNGSAGGIDREEWPEETAVGNGVGSDLKNSFRGR